MEEKSAPFTTSVVTVKLPTFWTHRAQIWFHQAEVQFNLRNIVVDDTKYWHLVAALDETAAERVCVMLNHPPAYEKYEELKKKLLDVFTVSESTRMRMLLDMDGLNGKTPTELMDFMLNTLGDHQNCPLLKELYRKQFPIEVQAMLSNFEFATLDALATAAEKIYKPVTYGEYSVKKRTVDTNQRGPPKSTKKVPTSDTGYCFYHNTYGAQAKRCNPPCSFERANPSGNASAGRQ